MFSMVVSGCEMLATIGILGRDHWLFQESRQPVGALLDGQLWDAGHEPAHGGVYLYLAKQG